MKKSNLIAFLFTLFAFGFLVPWWKGLDFLDPVLFGISCSIPMVFVVPLVTAENGVSSVRGRVSAAVAFAFTLTVLIAVNGIATVNLTHWFGRVLLPRKAFLSGVLLLDLAGAVFLAIVAAFLLRTMTSEKVRRVVRFAFFALLLVWVFVSRFAPPVIRETFDRNTTTDALTRHVFILSGVLVLPIAVLWRRALRSSPQPGA